MDLPVSLRYVDDGNAPIDSNLIERDIRLFTTGRKNWLFSATVAVAYANAVIYSYSDLHLKSARPAFKAILGQE